MIKINKVRLAFLILLLIAFNARAEVTYTELLKSLTLNKKNIVSEIPELKLLNNSDSLEKAREILLKTSYYNLLNTPSTVNQNQVVSLVKQRQITFVVVPGVLGEFIETRAFEELFARNSTFKMQWQKLSDGANASDSRFNLESNSEKAEKLSNLINAASLDDSSGQPLFKIIILKTHMGSLESVGSNVDKAKIFNRRLQKYMNLTQDRNLVMLGYSRGTP